MTAPACSRPPALLGTVVLVAILGTVTCSTSTGPAACDAPGVGTVTISRGASPDISWAASCEAEALDVFVATTGTAAWQLRAASRGIPKPVAYGMVPVGVTELHPAEALQVGATYGVFVTIVTPAGARLQALGIFTP